MLILGAGAMSVGCGAEGGHEEPELGEAGGPGVDGVHKGAFSPRLWPPTQPRSPSGGGGGGFGVCLLKLSVCPEGLDNSSR